MIGDVQGCYSALGRLLDKLNPDPTTDTLWFVGDLVNRGGRSLEVLRLVRSLGPKLTVVLGNHDMHLLGEAARHMERPTANREFAAILEAPDGMELIDWLCHSPLVHVDETERIAMIHAGLPPGWPLNRAVKLAARVESGLRSQRRMQLLRQMYGDRPRRWAPGLSWGREMRTIVNALTRMRYCDADGHLDFDEKGPPGSQPPHLMPWYEAPRRNFDYTIIFGHWSALGLYFGRQALCLDSGCVWGGPLSAIRLGQRFQLFQVPGGPG